MFFVELIDGVNRVVIIAVGATFAHTPSTQVAVTLETVTLEPLLVRFAERKGVDLVKSLDVVSLHYLGPMVVPRTLFAK